MRFKKTLIGIASIVALAGIVKGAMEGIFYINHLQRNEIESVKDVTGDSIPDITAYLYDGNHT